MWGVWLCVLLVCGLSTDLVWSCPRSCNCYQSSEVHCTFRSLRRVPPGLPALTRRINLGFNSIQRLHNSSLLGLKSVELLMLHSNELQELPPGAFRDLERLQILKLSYNRVEELWSEQTFAGLSSLLRLYLDHNLLRWIHPRALLLMPRLRLLRLQGNRLLQLHPEALCTLSLLDTHFYSTLRHLDLSNNSLSRVPRELLETAPLLETLILHSNPWSCDCSMSWLLPWAVSHPGVMKCPGSPQCPVCASPRSLQDQALLEQLSLDCSPPVIQSPGQPTPLDLPDILPRQSFRESLGTLSLSLSDQQGFSVDVACNISHTETNPNIPSELANFQSFPLHLALSWSLECHAEQQDYEKLWRIMAYYSESPAQLERGLMLSKTPMVAYRYKQAPESENGYHTGVKASIATSLPWLLQSAISIQLGRAKSSRKAVHLVLSTRVSAQSDLSTSPPWVLISSNQTITGVTALVGSKIELTCPILSSGQHKVEWIFQNGSKVNSSNNKWKVLSSGLVLQKVDLVDAGLYYCKASNGNDIDVLPLQLVVIETPVSATRELVKLTGVIGQPLTIFCNASGTPLPSTSWRLPNGNLLRRGFAISGGIAIETDGSLSLPRPSLRDAGHYRCIVVNQYGSASLSTELKLKPRQTPPLKTAFPQRPQSAAGRSTKIRAPLLSLEEGSGDVEIRDEVRNRRPILINQRRRGSARLKPVNERMNRVGTRNRVTPNRQQIDPKKWADLLAKIRKKAITGSDNQPAEPIEKGKVNEKVESSGDDTNMFEEGPGIVFTTKLQTNKAIVENTKASEMTTKADDATTKKTEPHLSPTSFRHKITTTSGYIFTTTPKDALTTSRWQLTTTENVPKVAETQETSIQRPFRPWNTRRRMGQRRRMFNRVRGRLSTPPQPLPDAVNSEMQLTTTAYPRVSTPPSSTLSTKTHSISLPSLHFGTHSTFHITSSEPAYRPAGKERKDMERNLFRLPSASVSSTFSPTVKITTSSPRGTQQSRLASSDTSASVTDSGDALLAVSLISQVTTNPGERITKFRPSAGVTNAIPTAVDTNLFYTNELMSVAESTLESIAATTPPASTTPSTATSTVLSSPITSPTFDSGPGATVTTPRYPATITTRSTTTFTPTTSMSTSDKTTIPTNAADLKTTAFFTTTFSTPSTYTHSAPATTTASRHVTTTTPTFTNKILVKTDKADVSTTSTTTTTAEKTFSRTKSNSTMSTMTRPRVPIAGPRQRVIPGTPGQIPAYTDWRNPGLGNSIPDSQSSRTHLPPRVTAARSRPRISPSHGGALSAPAESTAWLHCEAQGEPRPSVFWSKGDSGALIFGTSRIPRFKVLPNGTLVIHQVQLQDKGNYICSAYNSMGLDRMVTTLDVRTRPPRMQLPSLRELTAQQGGDLALDCRAEGEPTPLLSWVLPDRSVLSSPSSPASTPRISLDTNGTLRLSPVSPSDRGTYRCVASNSAGAASASVNVHVSSLPPSIQQPKEESLVLSVGAPLFAHCSARGAPSPSMRWKTPSGIYVRPSQFLHGNLFVLPDGTLHIRSVGPKDAGSYECSATNAVGVQKRVVRVELRQSQAEENRIEQEVSSSKDNMQTNLELENALNSSDTAAPPPIERPQTEVDVVGAKIWEDKTTGLAVPSKRPPVSQFSKALIVATSTKQSGERMELHCHVTGNPPPSVIWRTPSRKLVDAHYSFDRRLKVHPNGTLSMEDVTEKDGGDYLCIARNKVADDYRLVRVTVAPNPLLKPVLQPDRQTIQQTELQPKQPPALRPALNHQTVPRPESEYFNRLYRQPAQQPITPPIRHPDHAPSKEITLQTVPQRDPQLFQPAIQTNHQLDHQERSFQPALAPVRQLDQQTSTERSIQPALAPVSQLDQQTALTPEIHFNSQRNRQHGQRPLVQPNRQPNNLPFKDVILQTHRQPNPQPALSAFLQPNRQSSPPLVIRAATIQQRQPVHHRVSLGNPLQVDCEAWGEPAPWVRWSLPDGSRAGQGPEHLRAGEGPGHLRRLRVFPNGTLLLKAVGRRDEGEYTCTAENQAGRDTMKIKVTLLSTPPTFTDDTAYRTLRVQLGTTAKLPCAASGDPTPSITWLSPANRIIPWTSRSGLYTERVVVAPGGTLELRIAQRQDTGNYTCRAANDAGTISKVVRVEVELPSVVRNSVPGYRGPGLSTPLGVVRIGVSGGSNVGFRAENFAMNRHNDGGQRVVLNAVTNNNEVGAGKLSNDANRSYISGIRNIVARNSSSEAVASKPNDDANRRNINLSSAPANIGRFDSRSRNIVASNASLSQGIMLTIKQQAIKGQRVFLHCLTLGSSPSHLTWLVPGNTALLNTPYRSDRMAVHHNGTLEIRSVSAEDRGRYMCATRGESRLRVELDVKDVELSRVEANREQGKVLKPASRGTSTEQVVSSKTAALVSIINGETLRLPCSKQAGSQGPVSWSLPSGQRLSSSESRGQYSVQVDGTLTVLQASVFDRGTYTCRVRSPSGLLDVVVPVIVIAYPPRITSGPAPLTYTRPGTAVELPCLAIATPRASIAWEMPDTSKVTVQGQARLYGHRYLTAQGSLVIQNPSSRDTGFYRCTAKNVIGADTKATYLHVI